MTREEYLKSLKGLIQSLTIDEQTEALQYYSDYFEEADDDQKVISELGSPEELAKSIVEKFANALAEKESSKNSDEEKNEDFTSGNVSGALYYSYNASDVKNLILDLGAAEVVMISGKKYEIETRGMEKDFLSCSLSAEGSLHISNTRRLNFNFFSHDRRNRTVPRILLTVPENANLYKLEIHIGAGNFRTKGAEVRCQEGSLDVGAGNLVLGALYGGKIDIRCGMGNLEMDGTIIGNSNIDCGMGNVKLNLRGSEEDYSFDAKVCLGDLKFNDIKKSGVCQELDNQRKANHFSVNCGMGSVSIRIK